MQPIFIFAAVPLAVFLVLVALPRGRPALIGIGGAALVAIVGTALMVTLDGTGFGAALGMLAGSAIALAAIAQALRQALGPGRPRWVYPVIVLVALIAGSWPLVQSLGG